MPPLQVVLSIAGMIVVIVGAYYVTYYIGVKSSGLSRGRNRNIHMLDRFAISKDKSFCIVEIAGKVYIIGVTNQSMTLFDTLDAEVFAETTGEHEDALAWPPPGGPLSGLTKGLTSFLANLTGKTRVTDMGGTRDKSFEESMEEARDRSSVKPGDPEGKE